MLGTGDSKFRTGKHDCTRTYTFRVIPQGVIWKNPAGLSQQSHLAGCRRRRNRAVECHPNREKSLLGWMLQKDKDSGSIAPVTVGRPPKHSFNRRRRMHRRRKSSRLIARSCYTYTLEGEVFWCFLPVPDDDGDDGCWIFIQSRIIIAPGSVLYRIYLPYLSFGRMAFARFRLETNRLATRSGREYAIDDGETQFTLKSHWSCRFDPARSHVFRMFPQAYFVAQVRVVLCFM